MSKKNNPNPLVYSTNPEYRSANDPSDRDPVPPASQKIYVSLDRKQRGGKVVTLVEGFQGSDEQTDTLCRELKSKCGCGGSAKDGVILIQGDFRQKVVDLLKGKGYSVKTKGGN